MKLLEIKGFSYLSSKNMFLKKLSFKKKRAIHKRLKKCPKIRKIEDNPNYVKNLLR